MSTCSQEENKLSKKVPLSDGALTLLFTLSCTIISTFIHVRLKHWI
jgi:hypothetical protein